MCLFVDFITVLSCVWDCLMIKRIAHTDVILISSLYVKSHWSHHPLQDYKRIFNSSLLLMWWSLLLLLLKTTTIYFRKKFHLQNNEIIKFYVYCKLFSLCFHLYPSFSAVLMANDVCIQRKESSLGCESSHYFYLMTFRLLKQRITWTRVCVCVPLHKMILLSRDPLLGCVYVQWV